ncbi:MAG: hypothetical protein A3H91_05695 [Gammaproteobacteria bacterium RIFCSPLOWO2_02_FULL_61_13]|nr:MAG: hypothetical protein A3H91_05695 [Gammaproteobacteria bacterium RIFCSPLOWO2_02_FULL_61_13]
MNTIPARVISVSRCVVPALLLMCVALPFLFMGRPDIFGADSGENRVPAPLPSIPQSLVDYLKIPKAFDSYVYDNFGMRNLLIEANARLKYGLLGVSFSRKVLVGRNGWLFHNNHRDMLDYSGLGDVSEQDLRRWRIVLEERGDWLKLKHIVFGVAVAPTKQSIYAEFMPAHLGPRSKGSALDRLSAHMAGKSDVVFLDLRSALRAAKTNHQVYFKTDSHWNFHGALAGYEHIARAFPEIFDPQHILDYPDLVAAQGSYRTNLPAMLGMKGTEKTTRFERRDGWLARSIKSDDGDGGLKRRTGITRISEIDDPSLKRGLFIVDSFYGWNSQFFAEHFQRLVAVNRFNYGWKLKDAFPAEIIAAEKPDIVLMQFVEGHLGNCSKPECLASPGIESNPPEVRQARLQRLFAESRQAPGHLQVVEVVRTREPMARVRGGPATEPAWRVVFAGMAAGQHRSGPYLLRIRVEADEELLIRSAFSRKSACLDRQEVTDIQVHAGISELLLCADGLDHNGKTELRVIGNAGAVRFLAAEAVAHPDL